MNKEEAVLTAEEFDKQVEDRIIVLEAKYKDRTSEVHAVVYLDDNGDKVIGFIMEPSQFTKIRAMDKAIREPYTAAAELLEAILLKEESDPRIKSVDRFYRAAAVFVYGLLNYSANQFKKKSKTVA